jgi:hypothetical protein
VGAGLSLSLEYQFNSFFTAFRMTAIPLGNFSRILHFVQDASLLEY